MNSEFNRSTSQEPKVIINTLKLQFLDIAGLALLISINESLKKYDGGLRILTPLKEVVSRFSYINLNDLFYLYDDGQ